MVVPGLIAAALAMGVRPALRASAATPAIMRRNQRGDIKRRPPEDGKQGPVPPSKISPLARKVKIIKCVKLKEWKAYIRTTNELNRERQAASDRMCSIKIDKFLNLGPRQKQSDLHLILGQSSRRILAHAATSLFVAQRLDGVQHRGFARWIIAEENPHRRGKQEPP